MAMARHRLVFAACVLAVAALALVLGLLLRPGWLVQRALGNPFAARRFDANAWCLAASGGGGSTVRGSMALDLKMRVLRRGTPRARVRALLGVSNNSSHEEASGRLDRYYLGHLGSMSIDGDYLVIGYDSTGRVASVAIVEH